MKTKIITLALAVALTGFAGTAKANSNTRVNVGIGINYGTPAPVYVPAPVATPVYGYGNNYNTPARGHWENVTVKTWIPGRWVVTHNRWGRPVRVFEPGRYAFTTERRWVAHNRGNNYGGYGYNNDRDNRGGWNR